MSRVIKKSKEDGLLKSIEKLELANQHLTSAMASRDFSKILAAIKQSKEAADFWRIEAAKEEIPGIPTPGFLLARNSDRLCAEASAGLRLFFYVVEGGKV